MKHIFIVNPTVCQKGQAKELLTAIHSVFSKTETEYFVFMTESKTHATQLVNDMCDFFSDETIRFYVCGGIGTLCEAINGARDLGKVEFTLCPYGAGNDILKAFTSDIKKFLNLEELVNGKPIPMDLIKVNGKLAANSVCCGFDARVGRDMSETKFRRLSKINGNLSYVLPVINNMFRKISHNYIFEYDGNRLECNCASVAIMNSISYGGMYKPRPDAKINDGILNCLLVRVSSPIGVLKNVPSYVSGELMNNEEITTAFDCRQLTVRLKDGGKMVLNYDGETVDTTSISINVMPKAMQFVIPAELAHGFGG